MIRVSNPGRYKNFSFLQNVQKYFAAHTAATSMDTGVPSQGQSGRDVALPTRLCLVPRLRISVTLSKCLHGVDRYNFTFLRFISFLGTTSTVPNPSRHTSNSCSAIRINLIYGRHFPSCYKSGIGVEWVEYHMWLIVLVQVGVFNTVQHHRPKVACRGDSNKSVWSLHRFYTFCLPFSYLMFNYFPLLPKANAGLRTLSSNVICSEICIRTVYRHCGVRELGLQQTHYIGEGRYTLRVVSASGCSR
jgi:hypothetical protein